MIGSLVRDSPMPLNYNCDLELRTPTCRRMKAPGVPMAHVSASWAWANTGISPSDLSDPAIHGDFRSSSIILHLAQNLLTSLSLIPPPSG